MPPLFPISDSTEHTTTLSMKPLPSSSDVEVATDSDSGEQVYSALFERKTMRHVDWRLLPLLGSLYALSLIDRTNIGIALVTKMSADLVRMDWMLAHATISYHASISSHTFFSNSQAICACAAVGARNLLSGGVITWGAVQLAMGFVPTWEYLALCRTLLGVFEAGFFPALVFIVTTWYKRYEVQKKLAAMHVTSILAGGFSAILAYALSLLDGKGGLSGWAWIFIIEGAATIAFGIASWIFIPDFPDKNTFLTAKQTALVLRRIEEDRGDSVPDSLRGKVLLHLSDWKIWIFATMYLCVNSPSVRSRILRKFDFERHGLEFGDVSITYHSSLINFVLQAVSVIFFAWLSDRYRMRALFLAIQALMTIIGLALIGYADMSGWRYAGIFLASAGCSASIPGVLAYTSNNIVSQSKRAVTTAITVSFGGIGGIIATTIYRQQDLPRYLPGIIATISLQVLLLILLGIMTVYFWYENKKVKLQKDGQVGGFLYVL
ncbi:major facilitator superfamily domain-containing protein [Desarmillaria tabescens]|uniref:Major facilitator superfamily domain-containing protein n=1 Tax=Armillaria tabescens TaxID=1929756 RepID=A0AA39MYV2_ARMTA|nr:major facilitator superfamily domain-containing protein [Desarmillaria tabescens]KAK0451144.1 major facilitator superfamily domain-containing protein [Desarmillaria tabescens]